MNRHYVRLLLNLFIPAAEIVLVCFLGPKLLRFFLPFVIGWILAMIANPLVHFLESHVRLVRKHSSVLIVVAVLALIIGLGYFLVSRLVIQAIGLVKDLPVLYGAVSEDLQGISLRFANLFSRLPEQVQTNWQEFAGSISHAASLIVQKIASPTVEVAGNVAKGIPNALVNVIITILSSYFFIAEQDKIMEFWKKYLPESVKEYGRYLKGDMKRLIGGYFLAQFRIMFVVAVILIVGFLVMRIKYAFLLGVLVAVLDFLPLFGTGTILIPWAVFKLLSADYVMAGGMAVLYVLTQVTRQIIQPKIVGDTMGLSPLWSLVLLYLGFKLHGISGMILAVPIGIFVMNLYRYGAFNGMIQSARELQKEIWKLRRYQIR